MQMKVLRRSPDTALATVEFDNELLNALVKFKGQKPEEFIRGFKINKKGNPTFKCGLGYNVIDTDLMGDGTGKTYKEFTEKMGFEFYEKYLQFGVWK